MSTRPKTKRHFVSNKTCDKKKQLTLDVFSENHLPKYNRSHSCISTTSSATTCSSFNKGEESLNIPKELIELDSESGADSEPLTSKVKRIQRNILETLQKRTMNDSDSSCLSSKSCSKPDKRIGRRRKKSDVISYPFSPKQTRSKTAKNVQKSNLDIWIDTKKVKEELAKNAAKKPKKNQIIRIIDEDSPTACRLTPFANDHTRNTEKMPKKNQTIDLMDEVSPPASRLKPFTDEEAKNAAQKRKNKQAIGVMDIVEGGPLATRLKSFTDDQTKNVTKNSKRKHSSTNAIGEESPSSSSLKTFTKIKSNQTRKHNNYSNRYGMILPSFKDLMKEKENYEIYKKNLNSAISIVEADQKLWSNRKITNNNYEETRYVKDDWLNCEKLTEVELRNLFHRNRNYLINIYKGEIYCKRHQIFMADKTNSNSLIYNTSFAVFSFAQKQLLADLVSDSFKDETIPHSTEYYFKVLLPELCLKIFMDSHTMTYVEAENYLNDLPVEDI